MKKRNLKNLALNRRTISSLEATQNVGGNLVNSDVICAVTIGNRATCLETLGCYQTDVCIPVTEQKECASIFIACITQTEFPTCRDCE
ncbi:MAG: hypothetical protein AAF611_10475 [Bacteroidota bacterium]